MLKEKLFAVLDLIQSHKDDFPITNVQLDKTIIAEIEDSIAQLENYDPNLIL
ncbi:hypothetical protein [[Phormidium] sp. LEGE 05292]|uniref:hypothetical protein n=1 Tax=[Phormidium] sp. LEGE 05292 TaxID=767427 RepID=UPI00187F00FE|nr:hypothetical protein [Phormidium sp. LEGE 05292]